MKAFGDVLELLQDKQYEVVVLQGDQKDKQVLVSPQMVGRVMVSTMAGAKGDVLGWVNRPAVDAGFTDPGFNNFGGEERIWLGPDGTEKGFIFKDAEFTWDSFRIPQAFSSQPFENLGGSPDGKSVAMRAQWKLQNLQGTDFQVRLDRKITLLEACPYANEFGGEIDFVGFQSDNTVTNTGNKPITRDGGPLTLWLLNHYLPHKRSVLVVPFAKGPDSQRGPALRDEFFDYFRSDPSSHPSTLYRYGENYALVKANCSIRCKFGIGRPRCIGRAGSLDLDTNELVIVDNDFYPEMDYATNYWRKTKDLFDGDAMNICVDGPGCEGDPVFAEPDNLAYEIETISPALFLHPGQSYVSRSRTFRLRGKQDAIDAICRRYLYADRPTIEVFDTQES